MVKPIAFVLPQYHPTKENDEWWGEGFTEWRNVVKSKPRFKGHYQPHLPANLGYYDLRVPETREKQAELAIRYGVHGFCYYHYWFNGRRLLNQPVDDMLSCQKPNFPFMLCWANENWSRNWDGGFDKVLLKQNYSLDDFKDHADFLVNVFRDERYIRIDNKPVFMIYKDAEISDLENCISAFREQLHKHDIDIFLMRCNRWAGSVHDKALISRIFDGQVQFSPFTTSFRQLCDEKFQKKYNFPLSWRLRQLKLKLGLADDYEDTIIKYSDAINSDLAWNFSPSDELIEFPGVSPGWDNTSRRQNSSAIIIKDNSPEEFGRWVKTKIEKVDWRKYPEPFLFVNAWNEWAEGNHLEPCEKWGHEFGDALKSVISGI